MSLFLQCTQLTFMFQSLLVIYHWFVDFIEEKCLAFKKGVILNKLKFIITILIVIPVIVSSQNDYLRNPVNGLVTQNTSITFIWKDLTTFTDYSVQVSETIDFLTIAYQQSTNDTLATLVFPFQSGDYFWRVQATNGLNDTLISSIRRLQLVNIKNIANQSLWLMADSSLQLNVNNVEAWGDLSGNSNNAFQNTNIRQPIFIPNSINSKPSLRFNGGQFLDFSSTVLPLQPHTILFVSKANSVHDGAVYSTVTTNNGLLLRNRSNSGNPEFRFFTNNNYIYDIPLTTSQNSSFNIYTFKSTASAGLAGQNRMFINSIGQAAKNGSLSTSHNNNLRIGALSNALSNFFNGDLAEIIAFETALPDSSRELVEQYLRYKYAQQINLGPDIKVDYGFCPTNLDAGSGFTNYTWSNGDTTQSTSINLGGKYWVTAQDVFGYLTSDTIYISYPGNLTFQDTFRICLGDTLNINTSIIGSYTFNWSNGDTTSFIETMIEDTYQVTVTDDSGCIANSSLFYVDVDSFMISLGNDTSICSGNSIGLVPLNTLIESYQWSTGSGDTNNTLNITSSGVYSLLTNSINGCMAKDTINVSISGQAPSVDFNADTVCLGSPTSFTNLSSAVLPSVLDSVYWDFGFSNSNDLNPTITFPTDGLFPVILTAFTDAGCYSSKQSNVLVWEPPVSSFNLPYEACVNNIYYFNSGSSAAINDSITSYFWDFGNFDAATGDSINYTFQNDGNFNITHIVTTKNACSDTFSIPLSVNTSAPASDIVLLNKPPDNFITANDNIDFEWYSSTTTIFYSIQIATDSIFNNVINASNSLTDTTYNYSGLSDGKYYWRVFTYNICGDSTSSDIRSFSVFNLSNYTNMVLWLAADNGVDLNSNLVQQWNDQSINQRDAFQFNASNQPTLVPSSIMNSKPVLRFSGNHFLDFDSSYLELSPFTVFIVSRNNSIHNGTLFSTVTSNSGVLLRYLNDSGNNGLRFYSNGQSYDAGLSDSEYKIIRFRSKASSGIVGQNQYFINSISQSPSNFSLSNSHQNVMRIGSLSGVSSNLLDGDIAEIIFIQDSLNDSSSQIIEQYLRYKYAPPVNLGPDIVLSYGFCDTTISAEKDWFTNYLWSNGDTTSQISVSLGSYTVTVTDIFGYTSVDEIKVKTDVTTLEGNTTICLFDTLIYNTQIDTSIYNNFVWNDGDMNTIKYITGAGYYFYSVDDTNGCSFTSDTLFVQIDTFSVKNLLVDSSSLCAGNTIGVIDTTGIVDYSWSTGSNNSTTTVTTSGYYYLTATNVLGCISIDSVFINIKGAAPQINFTVDNNCEANVAEFTDLSTSNTGNIISWQWNFGDQNSSQDENPNHVYDTAGNYQVQLIIETDSGCTGMGSQIVTVKPRPIANIDYDFTCVGQPIFFQELSAPPFGSFILDRVWYFGNGDTATVMNPVVEYDSAGTYPVYHIVSAANGCTDTLIRNIDISPAINPQIEAENLCLGNDVQFYDATQNYSNVEWFWDFGDASTPSSQQNPKHSYIISGQYEVELTVTNALECTESVSKLITIAPEPDVVIQASNSCPGVPLTFSDLTELVLGDSTIGRIWTFGDSGYISRLPNPIHVYNDTGTYNVTLEITTEKGCVSSVTQSVSVVEGPQAAFDFSPGFGGAPLEVTFNNNSIGAVNYLWNFGDNTAPETTPEPVHIYETEGDYSISLIAESDAGCTDTAFNDIFITDALYDLIIMNLIVDRDVRDDCSYSLSTTIRFANQGTLPITSVKFTLRLNEKISVSEIWEGRLEPGEIEVYQFTSQTEILDCDNKFYLCAEATYPDGNADQTPLDNKSCVSVKPEIVVSGLFPNPATDVLSLDLIAPAASNLKIELVAYNGAQLGILVDEEIPVGYSHYDFDVSILESATYILKITYRQEEISRKFIILRNK